MSTGCKIARDEISWTAESARGKSMSRRGGDATRTSDTKKNLKRTDMWDTMGRKLQPSRRQSPCVARLSPRADRIRVGSTDRRLDEDRPSPQKLK